MGHPGSAAFAESHPNWTLKKKRQPKNRKRFKKIEKGEKPARKRKRQF